MTDPNWKARCQRRLAGRVVLKPSTHDIDHGDQQRVELDAGPCGKIEAFVHAERPLHEAAPELLVLKLPGTGGRAERSSQLPVNYLDDVHAEVWTWNPPGYGGSPGRASFDTMPIAALNFFDAVTDRRADADTKIWLMGNSLGCAVALLQASQRSVHGLILRNPPPLVQTIPHVAVYGRPGWLHPLLRGPAQWIAQGVPEDMDTLHTAAHCSAPAVFIQSQADTLVPPRLQAMVRDNYAGPQRLIEWEGLEHHGIPQEEHLQQLAEGIDWLRAQE
ncbi:alpha/beta hydrolase [Roseimaritima ulvae]|uniref:Alpha/beta hydrolase family protein n=1 Tax=Roseimaritima ulvae TaxID=980254 RepID=A0A5B9QWJ4_9BACT|nr:alpha/beta fold hydrolase [Roseimaritima ulvae]QEG43387.1 Alpha/beta hydrolase family protein [Roseimaritima ulvae]